MPATHENTRKTWKAASAEIRNRYKNVARDELDAAEGNVDAIVELITRKTGEARAQVEEFIRDVLDEGSASLHRAAAATREYADRATEMMGDTYEQMSDSLRAGYEHAQEMVQERPGQSVLVAFGVGALLGAAVTLVLCDRSRS